MADLKRTPLFDIYKKYGGKTIDFGGWELPVQFSSIKEEHNAVRTRAGLFDVSHMGEISVKGSGSLAFLQTVLTNDISRLKSGSAIYSAMCYENGGTVDDLLIYQLAENDYLLVVNASNTEKDYKWLNHHLMENVQLEDISEQTAQLALQGPFAEKVLSNLVSPNILADIGVFKFKENVMISGKKVLISRTGYTGEDGFEIYCNKKDAVELWELILAAGKDDDILPCGLGARDTLRFEANLPLYGQELSSEITPLEAGISFAVKLKKEVDFIGKTELVKQKVEGLKKKIVGIEMVDRGIPRHGYPVYIGDEQIGVVSTGTQSPTLKKNIGLALLQIGNTAIDHIVEVEIRGKRLKAKIVPTPFYKRNK